MVDVAMQSRTIALQLEPGSLVGFLLLGGSEPIPEGRSERYGLFTGVPSSTAFYEHALGAIIQDNKNTEFRCLLNRVGNALSVIVPLSELQTVHIHVADSGHGSWHFEQDNKQSASGFCQLATAKRPPKTD